MGEFEVAAGALRSPPNRAKINSLRPVEMKLLSTELAGSDAGGDTAACICSLIGTCRLNGLDPHLYLRHVLEHIATHPINRIGELLPCRVGPLSPLVLSRAA